MATLDANFDVTELDRALADVDKRGERLAPAFRELRKPLRGDQREHAKQQEGPDGAWQARSPLTEARRRAKNRATRVTKAMRTIMVGKPKRRQTPAKILGRLPAAVVVVSGDLFVRVTSRVPKIGRAHQQGERVGRGVRLPKRVFLWLSDRILETARDVIGEFIVKGWKR